MSTITTITGSDVVSTSRTDINTNFDNLNTDKIETSTLSTDSTFASASDAKIPSQLATKTYVDASVNPTGRSWNEYAADAGSTDAYAITLSGISAYATGQTFKFKANTANTGIATLNVSGLGAKTIKKDVTSDLSTGDILANQIVTVTYDGTNMQLISNPAVVTTPVVRVYTQSKTIPAGTTRFDITNPAGTTFRYTYDGTGTDPGITSVTYPTGWTIEIQLENANAANNGSFTITSSGANYFEITNASGVAQNDITVGGANSYIALSQTWTKPSGLKYVVVELVGGGGSGTGGSGGGGGGGYSRKTIPESSLGSTEPVLPGGGGAAVSGNLQVAGFTSFFGTHLSATGGAVGAVGGGTGGIGSGGDINAAGTAGGGDATAPGGSSFFGGGAPDGVAGRPYGGGAGAGTIAGGNGVVVLTEYYG